MGAPSIIVMPEKPSASISVDEMVVWVLMLMALGIGAFEAIEGLLSCAADVDHDQLLRREPELPRGRREAARRLQRLPLILVTECSHRLTGGPGIGLAKRRFDAGGKLQAIDAGIRKRHVYHRPESAAAGVVDGGGRHQDGNGRIGRATIATDRTPVPGLTGDHAGRHR
ncbi:MAG: hypothetical protein V4754_09345 [Pseudomonadota bacterium]